MEEGHRQLVRCQTLDCIFGMCLSLAVAQESEGSVFSIEVSVGCIGVSCLMVSAV